MYSDYNKLNICGPRRAHERIAAGHVLGKIVLRV